MGEGSFTAESETVSAKLERVSEQIARAQGMPVEFRPGQVRSILYDLRDPSFLEQHSPLVVDQSLYLINMLPEEQRIAYINDLRISPAMLRTQEAAMKRAPGTIQRHARIGLQAILALPKAMQQEELEVWLSTPFVKEAPDAVAYSLDIIKHLPVQDHMTLINQLIESGMLRRLSETHDKGYAQQVGRIAAMLPEDDRRALGIILSDVPAERTGLYGLNGTFAQAAIDAGHDEMVKPQHLSLIVMPGGLPPVIRPDVNLEALSIPMIISDYAGEIVARNGLSLHMRDLAQRGDMAAAQRGALMDASEKLMSVSVRPQPARPSDIEWGPPRVIPS